MSIHNISTALEDDQQKKMANKAQEAIDCLEDIIEPTSDNWFISKIFGGSGEKDECVKIKTALRNIHNYRPKAFIEIQDVCETALQKDEIGPYIKGRIRDILKEYRSYINTAHNNLERIKSEEQEPSTQLQQTQTSMQGSGASSSSSMTSTVSNISFGFTHSSSQSGVVSNTSESQSSDVYDTSDPNGVELTTFKVQN